MNKEVEANKVMWHDDRGQLTCYRDGCVLHCWVMQIIYLSVLSNCLMVIHVFQNLVYVHVC